jgi:hypothetical protein
MPPLKAGDLVKGKSKLLLRKRGRVVEVISDGPKKKYRVDWTDSTSGVIFGRSLEILPDNDAPNPVYGPRNIDLTPPVPPREDDNYRENDDESNDEAESDRDGSLGGENELQPEDGLVEVMEGAQCRYNFLLIFLDNNA